MEPARCYTHCDEIGLLVWQDMPNGDKQPVWQMRSYFEGNEFTRNNESEQIYRKEWKEIMDYLYSYPSIVVWVPFNEAWGQFKTEEITEWTKNYDPSRLVNSASGVIISKPEIFLICIITQIRNCIFMMHKG